MPSGLSASLGGVEPCPPLAAGCPPASRVGSVAASVGSGPVPATLRGDVYLTGPQVFSPFGLLISMPAAIGPFDLGTIEMRAGLRVGPRSGRVTIVSGPLPSLVEGVEVRLRRLELDLDRPGLLRNPTSCGDASAAGRLESQAGAQATAGASLPVVGCRRLGFRPRARARLVGSGPLRRGSRVRLDLGLRLRRADANLRALRVALPRSLRLGSGGLGRICSRADALAGRCPPGSRVGWAAARSPLLGRRLKGPVYVVRPRGPGRPDLALSLSAEGVEVQVRGRTRLSHGRLIAALAGLPDMPLSALRLRLGARGSGPVRLREGPCGRHGLLASVALSSQAGSRRRLRLRVATRPRCDSASSRGGARAAGAAARGGGR